MPPNVDEKKFSLADLQALMGSSADNTNSDLSDLLGLATGAKGGSVSNTANLSALTGKDMGVNPYMAAAGVGGAAIPFIQGLRLGREVKRYKPTNLVPQQAYDVVQRLSQELNAPVTNYGQRVQELNDARAARMAQVKKAGTSSDFLRALYSSEDMYNKGMRQIGMEGGAERLNRRSAYNAALANLGAQEAASAQKNREALAALKQARDLNYAKSGEGLINSLINSVVLKNDKAKGAGNKYYDGSKQDYTDFFNQFISGQGDNPNAAAGTAAPYQMGQAYGKPKMYNPQFQFDPALMQKNNSLYPFIKP
jgi:hypothetical protein